ncbi:MAG: translocation/assembly module TamB domain-containing protein, partial [Azoarcus sp.]|nr:translocation/assembly module TamB domain-containing protein [Azoarcus sp.]
SDDVVIVGSEEDEERGGAGLAVTADVTVSLGDALYLSALGLDTRLTGELALRLRDGAPLAASGTISTVGGSYKGYGQSLTIERGLINFQGPLDNPGLNVVALRKGLPVEAGIAVSGSARRPVIRLVSTPEVPDPEKLSWIVLGRSPSAGGGADMSLLLPAAQALLGGPGGGMTEQLSRSLGVDEFGIGQADSGAPVRSSSVVDGGRAAGEGNVGAQVFTIGKRLSPDLFVSFEQSLGGAESLVKLTYQLTRRISLVARGGTDNAADVFYTIKFR